MHIKENLNLVNFSSWLSNFSNEIFVIFKNSSDTDSNESSTFCPSKPISSHLHCLKISALSVLVLVILRSFLRLKLWFYSNSRLDLERCKVIYSTQVICQKKGLALELGVRWFSLGVFQSIWCRIGWHKGSKFWNCRMIQLMKSAWLTFDTSLWSRALRMIHHCCNGLAIKVLL